MQKVWNQQRLCCIQGEMFGPYSSVCLLLLCSFSCCCISSRNLNGRVIFLLYIMNIVNIVQIGEGRLKEKGCLPLITLRRSSRVKDGGDTSVLWGGSSLAGPG